MLFATLAQLPARDSAAAQRLWLAALDQLAALNRDSAFALFAAARVADPAFFPAQYEYVRLRWARGEIAAARREFATSDARGGTVTRCLAFVVAALPNSVTYGSLPANPGPLAELAALEERGDPSGCADTFLGHLLGNSAPLGDAAPSAVPYLRRAVVAAPEVLDNWSGLIKQLGPLGRIDEAETALREAAGRAVHPWLRTGLYMFMVELRRQQGDTTGAANLTRTLRTAARRDGRPGLLVATGALASNAEYRRLTTIAGAWQERWGGLINEGHDRVNVGDLAGGLPYLDTAVALADSVGRPWFQLVARMWRGRAYAKLGRSADAERELRRALVVGAPVPDAYYRAETWHNLAHAYEGEGRWTAAAIAVDSFVALTAPMRYDGLRMISLYDAGMIRWKAGWHAAAHENFAAMVSVIDDQRAYYYYAGEYYERIGDLADALTYYERARAHKKDQEPTLTLAGLVRVYEALSRDDSAEAAAHAHDATIAQWRPTEAPLLPAFLSRHGRSAEGVALDRDWARRQLGTGNVQGAAIATLQLVDLLLSEGHAESAAVEAMRAESLATSLHLTDELVRAGTLRGRALFALGDRRRALRALESAAAVAAAHPTADGVFTTQLALGDALAATGRPEAALAAYDRAARTVERVTVGLRGDLDRAGYRERHLRPFDGALRVLLGAANPTPPAIDAAVLWSQRRKAAALALATPDSTRTPSVLDRAALQHRLGPREALVDYLVTDSLVAAVVLTDRSATLVRLTTTRDSATTLIERLRHPLVTTFAGRLDLTRAPYDLTLAHALYAAFVRPLEPALGGRDRWLIAPDGPLSALPFEALVTRVAPGRGVDYAAAQYLIDRIQVSYLPSAQFLAPAAERTRTLAGARVLTIAASAPGSAREVAAVRAAFFPARVRVLAEEAATETAVRVEGPLYSIVHFATHAEANNADPLASHLRLAPDGANDGYLHSNEIVATRWRARLVVLSACATLGGRLYEGEGLMGLSRAFLAGGAGAVLATQWPIGSASADVMDIFYRRLAAGSSPDAALRDAQLTLRRTPGTSHPFYWGGFVLVQGR